MTTSASHVRVPTEVIKNAKAWPHQNPEKADLSSQEAYPWSSYHEYSKEGAGLVAADEILSMFSNDREKAIDAFKKYHQEEAEGFFFDIEEKNRIIEENVQSFTSQYLIEQKLEIEGPKLPENKKFRDELIGLLRKESDLSLRRIAEVLQINREIARRAVALLSKEPSP